MSFKIGSVEVGIDLPLFLIAGPCVIESRELCLDIAKQLVEIQNRTEVQTIFKASFDKANRSSIHSFRGIGFGPGLDTLRAVKEETGLPILTDVHESWQIELVANVVDCLQIPAFLCRQTDLICACSYTGKPINVKKGQFLSPGEMFNIIEKILEYDNKQILLTERGTFFGYNRLVNDMTSIPTMQSLGYPVVFDATHSAQFPSYPGRIAGMPCLAPILSRSGIAAGANGLFVEVHPKPSKSKSDAATILDINLLEDLVIDCKKIHEIVKGK